MPQLACAAHGGSFKVEESLLRVEWNLGNCVQWTVLANFGPGGLDAPMAAGRAVFEHGIEHVGPRLRIHPGGSCVSMDQHSTA
jgi:hypothetical protein